MKLFCVLLGLDMMVDSLLFVRRGLEGLLIWIGLLEVEFENVCYFEFLFMECCFKINLYFVYIMFFVVWFIIIFVVF